MSPKYTKALVVFRGSLHATLPVPLLLLTRLFFNSALFHFTQLLSESFATFLGLICESLASPKGCICDAKLMDRLMAWRQHA